MKAADKAICLGAAIIFAACASLITAIIPCALSAPKPAEAWSFMAYAKPYGRFKATTTRDAILVDNGVFRYSMQTPNCESFKVLNPENKSYILTTVTQYSTQWAPPIKYPKLKKLGTAKLLNLECTHYEGQSYSPGTTIDAWFTDAIPINNGLKDSFSRICALPTGYGLPIKVQFRHPRNIELMFELLKIAKTQVAVESLLVPKSYRYVKDQALFFFSDEDGKDSGVDEFMSSVRKKPATGAPAKK